MGMGVGVGVGKTEIRGDAGMMERVNKRDGMKQRRARTGKYLAVS